MRVNLKLLDNEPLDSPLPENGLIRWGLTFYSDDEHAPFSVVVPGEMRGNVPCFDGYTLSKDLIEQVTTA